MDKNIKTVEELIAIITDTETEKEIKDSEKEKKTLNKKIKKILKNKGITMHEFCNYGRIRYDGMRDCTY
ncbi:MAG: hypothetical protein GY756_09925 [bacterium]|nr:hypothetical protein [bacterium]